MVRWVKRIKKRNWPQRSDPGHVQMMILWDAIHSWELRITGMPRRGVVISRRPFIAARPRSPARLVVRQEYFHNQRG